MTNNIMQLTSNGDTLNKIDTLLGYEFHRNARCARQELPLQMMVYIFQQISNFHIFNFHIQFPLLISHNISSMQPQNPHFTFKDVDVPGLTYILSFITKQQESYIVSKIKEQQWNLSLKRRTQHYGYEYSYDRNSIAKPTQQIPDWCIPVKAQLQKYLNSRSGQNQPIVFDQVIVNEYQPGQGISPHIDNLKLFKDTIVSLSLSSECVMVFQKSKRDRSREKNKEQEQLVQGEENRYEYQLKRRSIVILEREARFDWKHSIPGRKKDNRKQRGVRYSITFRQMKKEN